MKAFSRRKGTIPLQLHLGDTNLQILEAEEVQHSITTLWTRKQGNIVTNHSFILPVQEVIPSQHIGDFSNRLM